MALNFPDPAAQTPVNTWSPTSTPSASTNGLTYLWDGAKWVTQAGVPNLHWTRTGSVLSPTNAGDDVQIASLNSGPLAGFRNQLINGDFRVWQRGTDFAAAGTGGYAADRWSTGGSSSCRVRRMGGGRDGGVSGFDYYARLFGTGDRIASLMQAVELERTGSPGPFAVGTTWTLSFYATVSSGSLDIRVVKVFSDTAITGNSTDTEILTFGEQVDTTWKRFETTFTVGSLPAATNACLALRFQSGNSGSVQNLPNGVNLDIVGVQLEPGPVATPFEHRPIGTELALCQRYYQAPSMSFRGWLAQTGSATKNVREQRPVVMRAAPTEAGTGAAGTTVVFSGSADMVSITINNTANTATATVNNYTADAEL